MGIFKNMLIEEEDNIERAIEETEKAFEEVEKAFSYFKDILENTEDMFCDFYKDENGEEDEYLFKILEEDGLYDRLQKLLEKIS